MKKILFLSRDPGGTNVLIPLILKFQGLYEIAVFSKDNAYQQYFAHDIPCSRIEDYIIDTGISNLVQFLKRISPDLVITGTSSDDFTERYLWIASGKLSIPSIAILDSWCNYGIRFSRYSVDSLKVYSEKKDLIYCPDYIIVQDEYAKTEMEKAGIRKDKVIVCGQPYLQYICNKYKQITSEQTIQYLEDLCGSKEKKLILYASDNLSDAFPTKGTPYWGYDEKSIFINLVDSIDKVCKDKEKYLLAVRPHPKEKPNIWEKYVKELDYKIQIIVDRTSRSELAIKSSDLVVGMWSILLAEAAIAKKRILSMQIGAVKEAPFILSERGLIKPLFSQEELEKALENYFINHTVTATEWKIEDNAVEKISDFLNSII